MAFPTPVPIEFQNETFSQIKFLGLLLFSTQIGSIIDAVEKALSTRYVRLKCYRSYEIKKKIIQKIKLNHSFCMTSFFRIDSDTRMVRQSFRFGLNMNIYTTICIYERFYEIKMIPKRGK